MNYLDKIKNAMKPQLHEVTINDVPFWIQRPSLQDIDKCTTLATTLQYCVKDENGDPIFSDSDIEGRINVNTLDFKFAQELNQEVFKLLKASNNTDEVEKK